MDEKKLSDLVGRITNLEEWDKDAMIAFMIGSLSAEKRNGYLLEVIEREVSERDGPSNDFRN